MCTVSTAADKKDLVRARHKTRDNKQAQLQLASRYECERWKNNSGNGGDTSTAGCLSDVLVPPAVVPGGPITAFLSNNHA